MYTDNNLLMYILTSAELDTVGQCWVAALVNYNFNLHYKTCKSNVFHSKKPDWNAIDLDCLIVIAIIMGCTTETSIV